MLSNRTNKIPDISIIVPVYNTEKYLGECLESIVNQTFKNIEILCVDDGSTDRSRQIIEKYASIDFRIMSICKENGGLASARNAAYPVIRGKYALFVDSDDYIERGLCEKVFSIAEREHADMTFFLYHSTSESYDWFPLEKFLKNHSFSEIDLPVLMQHMTAWSKLWKTNFLLDNNIRFPEGLHFEDNVAHWKAMLLKPKLAVVPERLYWYRFNPDSISNDKNSIRFFDIIYCFDKIKNILNEKKQVEQNWLTYFCRQKLESMYWWFHKISPDRKPRMAELILQSLGNDEKSYLNKKEELASHVKNFYDAIQNQTNTNGNDQIS